jgi:hypothetical protein
LLVFSDQATSKHWLVTNAPITTVISTRERAGLAPATANAKPLRQTGLLCYFWRKKSADGICGFCFFCVLSCGAGDGTQARACWASALPLRCSRPLSFVLLLQVMTMTLVVKIVLFSFASGKIKIYLLDMAQLLQSRTITS